MTHSWITWIEPPNNSLERTALTGRRSTQTFALFIIHSPMPSGYARVACGAIAASDNIALTPLGMLSEAMNTIMHQAVRTNFAEKVAYVAHVLPTMTVIQDNHFVAVDCGLPSETFNIIVARDLLATDHLVQAGVGHFMAKLFPMALWYWDDESDRQKMSALTSYGLTLAETHIAMYLDLRHIQVQMSMPEELTIRSVAQADDLRHYGAVITELFGDTDEGRQVAAYHSILSTYEVSAFPALRYYLGVYHGKIAAIGCLFIGTETIGIYDIVTRNDYRRKGIGSTMFGYLISEAQRFQHRYAVLQASSDGLRIYERAGFAASGKVHTFENRELL
jgi:GNAT superfamily N-acetyltransferase